MGPRRPGLKALAKLWKRGQIERDDLLSWMLRLASLLDPHSGHDSLVANQLVGTAVQIGAFEIRGTIPGLCEREIAEDSYCDSGYAADRLQPNARLPAKPSRWMTPS